MAYGTTTELDNIIEKDSLACQIANQWVIWDTARIQWVKDRQEIQEYIFATDTSKTSNSSLPWKNRTVLPKLCQIRDNLYANYMASMFPKRKWLEWEADNADDQTKAKKEAIEGYMENVISRPEFRAEMSKMVLDFIDYGNVIATKEWIDQTQIKDNGTTKVGYVGPIPKRINPVDIVFNPAATSFDRTGKIIRSLMTLGDFISKLESETPAEDAEDVKKIVEYMRKVRIASTTNATGSETLKDRIFTIAGFNDFNYYLQSGYVEVLQFYGDLYDVHNDKFYKNSIITVVDRHKLVSVRDNPSALGTDGLHHCGWRMRQDNLWAMGPLDNLVGMQYRIDHIENLKADVFDLVAAPPLAIKGMVDEFEWKPFSKIYLGEDGAVEVLAPDVQALNANLEITNLQNQMEEMAGSPKEAAGFRTPGEKTAYEVQRLENAASRIFQARIKMFEEQIVEPLMNDMLEEARRRLDSTTIRQFDTELNAVSFASITKDDLSGSGRIKPRAASMFADKAEKVQNLNTFFQSALGVDPDIKAHFSSIKLAELFEDLLDIEDYEIVMPYVRLSEQQEAQKLMNAGQEQVAQEAMQPAGMAPHDQPVMG